jgi:hypothetical protein
VTKLEPGNIVDYWHKDGPPHWKLRECKGVILWLDERYDSVEVVQLDDNGHPSRKAHVISFKKIIGHDVLTELSLIDRDIMKVWTEECKGRNGHA